MGFYIVRDFLSSLCACFNTTFSTSFRFCGRRHPVPSAHAFDGLLSACNAVGVTLDTTSSKELAISLDEAELSGNPFFNRLLRILTTR